MIESTNNTTVIELIERYNELLDTLDDNVIDSTFESLTFEINVLRDLGEITDEEYMFIEYELGY